MNIDLNALITAKILLDGGGGGGGGSYPWFGPGTEYVGRKLEKTINLKDDTTFDSWTASTTAGQIKAASSSADFSVATDSYDYVWTFVSHYYVDVQYSAGATLQKAAKRLSGTWVNLLYPYFKDETGLANGFNAWDSMKICGRNMLRYYGSAVGVLNITTTAYGPMYINTDPTITPGASTTYKLAKIQACCNNYYFATDRKSEVDSENTNMAVTVDVYKTPVADHYICKMLEIQRTDLTTGL